MDGQSSVGCMGRNAAGKPCTAQPVRPSGWCYFHDPALAEERAEWRRKDGRSRSNEARAKKQIPAPMTAVELEGLLSQVLKAVIVGKIEPGVATAAAGVARAMIEVAKVGRLERQIAELERGGRAS